MDADHTHRAHAVIEQTFADLIDGPLAHLPAGRFAANAAWLTCAGIAHNLLRAAGTLARGRHPAPATGHHPGLNRPPRPDDHPAPIIPHLPAHWPWTDAWTELFTATHPPPATA